MEALITDLRSLVAQENYEELVRDLLAQYVREGHQDWKRFQFWNKYKYARNLVEINVEFEMIVLCWEEGQESPIHNHSSQDCWYAILEGDVEEIYYHFDEQKRQLNEGQTMRYHVGQVGHIADDIALHKIRPFPGQHACTLHVYSKPIPVCQVYDPCSGQVTTRTSGFYTVKGKKYTSGDSSVYKDVYESLHHLWPKNYCQLYSMHDCVVPQMSASASDDLAPSAFHEAIPPAMNA